MKATIILTICLFCFAYAKYAPINLHQEPFGNKAFDPRDVTYWVYTKTNPDTPIELFDGFLNNAPIDLLKPTKFIVHGIGEDSSTRYIGRFKDNYMLVNDYNIIVVDWKVPASGLYNNVQENVQPTGETVGAFIEYYRSQGSSLSTCHCIGYGLGAHVCGFAGKVQLVEKLGRITGLDPALDNYDIADPTTRLADTDASFVDIIHTCGGLQGFLDPIGHADFYPNGGVKDQPGCDLGDIGGDCSHGRAQEFFEESILTGGFRAYICTSYDDYVNDLCIFNPVASMGERCLVTVTHGDYYLSTYGKSPYAQG